jgi:hypothetical protein
METMVTEQDFDRLSWHDNYVYGIHFSIGDIERGDWRTDLVLDVDHIIEWVCGVGQAATFRVAPATLTFHHVTDLRLAVDWGDSGHRAALHELSIGRITRAPISDQKLCLDRPYWRWCLESNWPAAGEISFGASGFTQILRGEPVLQDEQKLARSARAPFRLP